MVKTFTLPRRGNVLTSPMNAGSLELGDVIIKDNQWTTIESVSAPYDHQGSPWVLLTGKMSGLAWQMARPINHPMDRVTGARSGGQII